MYPCNNQRCGVVYKNGQQKVKPIPEKDAWLDQNQKGMHNRRIIYEHKRICKIS